MASDPVVALCSALLADADVQRSDTLRMAARALLVAWDALGAIQPMHPDLNRAPWVAADAQQAILAIVGGRDDAQGSPFRAAKTTPLYPATTRERAIARDLAEEGRDG